MADLQLPIPMTQRVFYPSSAVAQNRTKIAEIASRWYQEIRQAEQLTNVPGSIIVAVIFTESAGNPSIVSSAGAVGLMQLKPQTGNDVIHLEKKSGRLTDAETAVLRRYLGARLDGPLKQKYLSHKIRENNYTGNVMTKADLQKPELNILLGAMYLGILIDQHYENGILRLDKVVMRYNQGYFFKIPAGNVEATLDFAKGKSKEAYTYALKVVGKNGLIETQA
jgi:soluble lytic murein transglycosylase-like protein